jgi:hypothetical protein
VTGEPEIHVSRARARERPNKTTCHICHWTLSAVPGELFDVRSAPLSGAIGERVLTGEAHGVRLRNGLTLQRRG